MRTTFDGIQVLRDGFKRTAQPLQFLKGISQSTPLQSELKKTCYFILISSVELPSTIEKRVCVAINKIPPEGGLSAAISWRVYALRYTAKPSIATMLNALTVRLAEAGQQSMHVPMISIEFL